MRNRDVETKLKNAVERLVPDVLDDILLQCGGQQKAVYIILPQKRKRSWIQAAGALAAAFMLVFGGLFAYNQMNDNRINTRIMLDVNPNIELRLNKDNRVIDVATGNEDAVIILNHMDLINTSVDVAINALIGSMLKHGYIQENANSVLLSVEGLNGEKSAALQRILTESISQHLNVVNGAVISQNLKNDASLKRMADEYQISYGKAALIQKILNVNSHLQFADLAQLTVNELNLLVDSKHIEAEGLESFGNASDVAYIGKEGAKQAALEHADILESAIERFSMELDYDDGAMVYDVEFYHGGTEYEYEINATDGAIIRHDRENRDNDERWESENNVSLPQNKEDFIGEEKAIEIVKEHSGVQSVTDLKIELDKDDGVYIYEVEFNTEYQECDYEINATTGEILSWEMED